MRPEFYMIPSDQITKAIQKLNIRPNPAPDLPTVQNESIRKLKPEKVINPPQLRRTRQARKK